MSVPQIEFTLIENAIDSIERAVELLAWKDVANEHSRLKQAILLVAHSTELLLKERLRRIHPTLIWDDVDKYPRLDARTVGVDKALSRLRDIGGISISQADADTVKALRNTRNAIEHFQWQVARDEVNSIVGQGLSFAIHFARDQLDCDITIRFRDDDTWQQLLAEHAAFALAHGERLEDEMRLKKKFVQQCIFCNAMAQDIQTGICSLCKQKGLCADDEPF